jgi:hypothetical protein
MQFQGAEPTSRLTVALEFSLPALECIKGNIPQDMQVALGFSALAFTLLYRILSGSNDRTPFLGFLPRFLQRDFWEGSETHFVAAGVEGITQNPLSAAVLPLIEPEAASICVLSWGLAPEFGCGKAM